MAEPDAEAEAWETVVDGKSTWIWFRSSVSTAGTDFKTDDETLIAALEESDFLFFFPIRKGGLWIAEGEALRRREKRLNEEGKKKKPL